MHWRTKLALEDMKAVMPLVEKMWIQKINIKGVVPRSLRRAALAAELVEKLPYTITLTLHAKGDARIPLVLKAFKITDPRIYKGGKYHGLKPHWEQFEWVDI